MSFGTRGSNSLTPTSKIKDSQAPHTAADFNSATLNPSFDEAKELLERVLPRYAEHGVRIDLETYEQVQSRS